MSANSPNPKIAEMGDNYKVGVGCALGSCSRCFHVLRVVQSTQLTKLPSGKAITLKKWVISGCEKRDGKAFPYTPKIHREVLWAVEAADTGRPRIDAQDFFDMMGEAVGYEPDKEFRRFERYFNGKWFPVSVKYDNDDKKFIFYESEDKRKR